MIAVFDKERRSGWIAAIAVATAYSDRQQHYDGKVFHPRVVVELGMLDTTPRLSYRQLAVNVRCGNKNRGALSIGMRGLDRRSEAPVRQMPRPCHKNRGRPRDPGPPCSLWYRVTLAGLLDARRQRPRKTAEAIRAAAGAQVKHRSGAAREQRLRSDEGREGVCQIPEQRAA